MNDSLDKELGEEDHRFPSQPDMECRHSKFSVTFSIHYIFFSNIFL